MFLVYLVIGALQCSLMMMMMMKYGRWSDRLRLRRQSARDGVNVGEFRRGRFPRHGRWRDDRRQSTHQSASVF